MEMGRANLFFGPTFNLEIFQRLNNGWGYGRGFQLHWKRCGANTNGGGIESDCWREMAYRLRECNNSIVNYVSDCRKLTHLNMLVHKAKVYCVVCSVEYERSCTI